MGNSITLLSNILTLSNTLAQLGLGFQELAELEAQAKSEGREINADDLAVLREKAQASVDSL